MATYHPAVATYVLFGFTFLVLLVTLGVLVCLGGRVNGLLPNAVHINLVVSLLLVTILYIIGIERTEEEVRRGEAGREGKKSRILEVCIGEWFMFPWLL